MKPLQRNIADPEVSALSPNLILDTQFLSPLSDMRRDQMASILNLSHTMLANARAEDWQALAVLEAERRALIADVFSEQATTETAAAIEQAIRLVLSMDKEILILTEKTRDTLGAQINQLMTGQKANKAYQQNSR